MSSTDRNKLLMGDNKSMLSANSSLMSKWSLKTELTSQTGMFLFYNINLSSMNFSMNMMNVLNLMIKSRCEIKVNNTET